MGVDAIAEDASRTEADRVAAPELTAEGFEDVYHAYVNRIYALCLRMTSDPRQAEEHTQECFVNAWRNMDKFRGDGNLGAWLRRLAINSVIGGWRKRGRRGRVECEVEDPSVFERPRVQLAPGESLDLEQAMTRLPVRARAVFTLYDVEGYRHQEIASMLGIREGTSKAQLHRARRILREAMESR